MTQLTVHHLNNSRSQRVLWLAEELGVEYDIKYYTRDPKTERAPSALRDIHPLGKAPVVTMADGTVIAESGAIIDELIDRFGNGGFRPQPGTEAHRQYRYWMYYAEGSLMPPLLVKLIMDRIRDAPVPFFLKPIGGTIANQVDKAFTDAEIALHLDFVDAALANAPWFAGDELSGADIQMSFPLEAAANRAGAGHPNVTAWLAKIHARPAYQRALERGGPYEIG